MKQDKWEMEALIGVEQVNPCVARVRRLVKRLRSGKDKQCRGMMSANGSMCVLGVALDEWNQEYHAGFWKQGGFGDTFYLRGDIPRAGWRANPPPFVMQAYGFRNEVGELPFCDRNDRPLSLPMLNDGSAPDSIFVDERTTLTFDQLADVIEYWYG